MDLRTFISTALADIVGGIEDAQKETEDSDAVIVPGLSGSAARTYQGHRGLLTAESHPTTVVEFDVAVTATEGSSGKLGGGAKLQILWFGADAEEKAEHSNVSRISFAIPVRLPQGAPEE